jgi:hypothetical protein
MYIFAISTNKEYVYFFNNSIIRMSLYEYDINSRDIWVHTTHSTVVDQWKENPELYKEKIKEA